MHLVATDLPDLFVIEAQINRDARGFFARSYCEDTFSQAGILFRTAQCNISLNSQTGTLRGMHFQTPPYAQAKIVRCTAGRIFDVALDLRPESATYCRWFGLELSAGNYKSLFIPEGFAHGFITLTDNAEVLYQMGAVYSESHGGGVRWNDPVFGIEWPIEPQLISEKDAAWPDFVK